MIIYLFKIIWYSFIVDISCIIPPKIPPETNLIYDLKLTDFIFEPASNTLLYEPRTPVTMTAHKNFVFGQIDILIDGIFFDEVENVVQLSMFDNENWEVIEITIDPIYEKLTVANTFLVSKKSNF